MNERESRQEMSRFFFRLEDEHSFDYLSVIYFIFRIGPGVGVGVDQKPGSESEPESEQPHHDSRTPGD